MAIAIDVDIAVRRQQTYEEKFVGNRTKTPETIYYARARDLRAQAFVSFFRSLGHFSTAALKPLRRMQVPTSASGGLAYLRRG